MGTVLGQLSKRIQFSNAVKSMRNATGDIKYPNKTMTPSNFGRFRKYLNRRNEPCCAECAEKKKKDEQFNNCCGQ